MITSGSSPAARRRVSFSAKSASRSARAISPPRPAPRRSSSAVSRGLQAEQLRVKPAAREQLLVRAIVDELAVLENEYAVSHPHRGKAVGDQHRHATLRQLGKAQEHLILSAVSAG